jgi:hypothetical protein
MGMVKMGNHDRTQAETDLWYFTLYQEVHQVRQKTHTPLVHHH